MSRWNFINNAHYKRCKTQMGTSTLDTKSTLGFLILVYIMKQDSLPKDDRFGCDCLYLKHFATNNKSFKLIYYQFGLNWMKYTLNKSEKKRKGMKSTIYVVHQFLYAIIPWLHPKSNKLHDKF